MLPTYGPTAVVTKHGSSATYPIISAVAFVITRFEAGGSTGLTISGWFQRVYSTGYVAGGPELGAPDPNATSWFMGLID